MKTKNKRQNRNHRETKKAIVMNSDKKNPTPIIIATVVVIAVTAGLGLFLFPGSDTSVQVAGTPPVTTAENSSRITYAINLFDDGKARHFHYADTDGNTTINYFILKSADGVIRAAFDACDVCWPEGKGYYQEGSTMVCRNCGRRFESVKVNEVKGGCNPAPLNRTIEGNQLVIHVEDLKKGKSYFDFSKKA